MKLLRVVKSTNPKKKYMAIFLLDNGRQKTTHFGYAGMNDYTLTKDKSARLRYWSRHAKDLRTNDPTRAGYLSLFILWNKSTVRASVADYRKRFSL